MQEAVLYTGTFDPYHLGHLKQLEYTYETHPFQKAAVGVIMHNPKKPHATPWQKRIELARLALSSKRLPFEVVVHPLDYITPNELNHFTATHLAGYSVFRTLASDSVQEFIEDEKLRTTLTMFHYAIIIRPLVGREKLERIIAALPPEILEAFSYEIVYDWGDVHIAATNLRKDIRAALEQNYITKPQFEYIAREHLYQFANKSS
jgi:cytidyltransferase-like protein